MRVATQKGSSSTGPPDLSKVFEYAKLSGQYAQTKDVAIRQQLREIEQELGMSAEEIMDLALRNTDLFNKK